jgi:hypothetical protein
MDIYMQGPPLVEQPEQGSFEACMFMAPRHATVLGDPEHRAKLASKLCIEFVITSGPRLDGKSEQPCQGTTKPLASTMLRNFICGWSVIFLPSPIGHFGALSSRDALSR